MGNRRNFFSSLSQIRIIFIIEINNNEINEIKINLTKYILPCFVIMMLARTIGFFFFPLLLKIHPFLLLILSPFLHHLILCSTLISPALFLIGGSLIATAQCILGYYFGKIHGIKGIEWFIERLIISENKVMQIQKWIRFSAPLVLFVFPGPLAAMLAGASNLRSKTFFITMIPAQIMWISACYLLGKKLELYLNAINNWLIENWIILTISILLIKLLHIIFSYYKAKDSKISN